MILLEGSQFFLASRGVIPKRPHSLASIPCMVWLQPHSLTSSLRLSLRWIKVLASSQLLASSTSWNWSRKHSTSPVPSYFGDLKVARGALSPILSRAWVSLARRLSAAVGWGQPVGPLGGLLLGVGLHLHRLLAAELLPVGVHHFPRHPHRLGLYYRLSVFHILVCLKWRGGVGSIAFSQ